jgi:hypothetical protein
MAEAELRTAEAEVTYYEGPQEVSRIPIHG